MDDGWIEFWGDKNLNVYVSQIKCLGIYFAVS